MAVIKQNKFTKLFNTYRPVLQKFFEGKLYPLFIALFVFLGHVTALELLFGTVLLLSVALALVVCDTVKPFLPALLMVLYIVSVNHTPGVPSNSDYFTRLYVLIPLACCFIAVIAAAVYFTVKNIAPQFNVKEAPIFISLTVLSAAFLLNGAFSSGWKFASLIFGLAEIVMFFLLFYFLYYGLKKEDTKELLDYICYIALLASAVLVAEMVFLFITNDKLISESGSIIKEEVYLGWATCNPMGFSLGVIIPLLMRGAMVSKYRLVYLGATLATWVSMVLTMSRNALIFGTLALGVSFIIGAFFGPKESRTLFRVILALGAVAAVLGAIVLWDKISGLLADVLSRGFDNNGRFEIWKSSWENFKKSPIFGRGFFDWGEMEAYESAPFIPTMSHNTLFQLLSSMGIFGTLAYGYYRFKTAAPFIKNFSFDKAMLMLPILYTMGASLLDTFIFSFHTAFVYTVALAIAFKMKDDDTVKMLSRDSAQNSEQ